MPIFTTKNNLDISYTDTGQPLTPVLLLHGLGSRGSDWQPQIDALQQGYRVITLDFPGHGSSDPLHQPTSINDLALIVKSLLDHLNISKTHVVGLSLGGMVAFQLAVDFPLHIQSMTIINSGPGPGKNVLRLKLRLFIRRMLLQFFTFDKLAVRIGINLFPEHQQEPLRQQFLASMKTVDQNTYNYMVNAIGRFNVESKLGKCEIPALILAADNDYTEVAFKQHYVDKMADATLTIIPNSRHASPLDSPEYCNQEILNFLSQQS